MSPKAVASGYLPILDSINSFWCSLPSLKLLILVSCFLSALILCFNRNDSSLKTTVIYKNAYSSPLSTGSNFQVSRFSAKSPCKCNFSAQESNDVYILKKWNASTLDKCHARQRLPDFFILGPKKSGIQALLKFVNLHPKICTVIKETKFFHGTAERDVLSYMSKMPCVCPNQVIGERGFSYFLERDIPRKILKVLPNIKIIFILREPLDRAVSDYKQYLIRKRRNNAHPKSIKTFQNLLFEPRGKIKVDHQFIKKGIYVDAVRNWLQSGLPRKNSLFVDTQSLLLSPASVVQEVEQFLGLKPAVVKEHFYFNQTKGYYCFQTVEGSKECLKKGNGQIQLNRKVAKKIEDYYRPFNQKLFTLIEKRFDWVT